MRCFIAIDIDEKFTDKCVMIQNQMKKLNIKGSYVKPENIHMTLKFFHTLEKEKAMKIMKEYENKIKQMKEFTIELHNLLAFIKRGDKSIVWLSIDRHVKRIKILSEILNEITDEYYDEKENNHKFKAHFTLLRTRLTIEEEKELLEKLDEIEINLKTKIKNISLYKSELTPTGSIYTNLYTINLNK